MAKSKTVKMSQGEAIANPLVDQVPLWEKKGWVQCNTPETVPDEGTQDKPHKEQ